MDDFVFSLMEFLYDAFISPLKSLYLDYLDVQVPDVSFGFGSVTWFSMSLTDLLFVALSIFVVVFILISIFKVIKTIYKLFGGKK